MVLQRIPDQINACYCNTDSFLGGGDIQAGTLEVNDTCSMKYLFRIAVEYAFPVARVFEGSQKRVVCEVLDTLWRAVAREVFRTADERQLPVNEFVGTI